MCVSHRCRRCGSRGSAGLETSTFSFSAPQAVSALQLTRAGSRRCVSRSSWSQACPEACCRLPLPCAGPWQSVELPDRLRQSPLGTARGCTCISLSEYRLSLIRRAALAWPQHAMWKYPKSQLSKLQSELKDTWLQRREREQFQLRKHPWPWHAPAVIL